ncbi:hypothetical protein RclHR1_02670010 [Rhizophagus clarus]|uniref:BTB domain-containing protein n=1 Tax=Rhizophagus clarus TaxID=94130 RepID=A0A2Z6RGK6_9GLOM|nr:hypothetical protein RclHR1_02670010 [Rhizophagus clarus]GES82568.1 hypothetical protein GLOIN_2v1696265 [Rhizophagus clarus]
MSLSSDLRLILDDPTLSDIKIKGNDGGEINAHRLILVARSEVFKRMLLSDMKEATQDVIEFQEFSSKALQVVVEYLYTGKVTKNFLKPGIVFEALCCADYFLLEMLMFHIISFVRSNMEDKMNILAKILSRILESSCRELANYICELIDLVSLKSIDYHNLSAKALEYILSYQEEEGINMFSLSSGYDLFRYITLWAASEISEEALTFYESYLPSPETVRNLDSNDMQKWDPNIPFTEELHVKYRSEIVTKTSTLLDYVNLEVIHPLVFSNELIRDLIDSNILKDVYRKQALLAGSYFSMLRNAFQWKVKRYRELDNPFVFDSQSPVHEWVRTKFPFSGHDLIEWDIVVEKMCKSFWVGVCSDNGFNVNSNSWLGQHSYGWVLGSNGFICHHKKDKDPFKNKYGRKFNEKSRITVRLDMKERTCSFAIDGTKYPIAFRDLPDEIYPAVSLMSPGVARIEPLFGRT